MNEREIKTKKDVFVIMPFSKTNNRNEEQLTNFFKTLQSSIEEEDSLPCRYRVRRSSDDFNITDQIIRNLFNADIVIADISGEEPNPNVMYELGVRLALSEKPVILIREGDKSDSIPFDLKTYHTEFYDPFQHEKLIDLLVDKLKRLESGEMKYESPVKKILMSYHIFSQRERLRTFCSHVVGEWWQHITESVEEGGETKNSLSYVKIVPDEVTNEVRMSGETYNKTGELLGSWKSLAVGLNMELNPIIFYSWDAKFTEPGKETSGFGEFENFKPSNAVFTQASGRFMNTHMSDKRKSWWKYVSIKRILKKEDIHKMNVGSENEKRKLVQEALENWDNF